MLPVLLGAFRGICVGYDTSYYAYPVFIAAREYSRFFDFIGYLGIEPAFLLLEYVGSKYLHSFAFVLGVTQFIINYGFYKAIKKHYGDDDLAINMMIFYFFIYGATLNAIRQSIAVSLFLLAMTYYSEKKYVYAILLSLLAFMFHISSLIILLFICLYSITDKKTVYKAVNTLIIVFSIFFNVFWKSIFTMTFSLIQIFGNKYSDYLIYGESGDRNETSIICGIIALIIIICVNKKSESNWNRFLISTSLVFVCFQPIGERLSVAYRLLMYPQSFLIMIFPLSRNILKLRIGIKDSGWVINLGLFLLFFSIWYYSVIMNNSNSILPYTFLRY